MIGGEDDGHPGGFALLLFPLDDVAVGADKVLGGGGGGKGEVAELEVRGVIFRRGITVRALADIHIRANGEGMDGVFRLGGPLAEALREQGKRVNEK